jgi:hypothetical protein
MIYSLRDHFCKRTKWSLIYFWIYTYLNILAQSQILVISLYVEADLNKRSCSGLKTPTSWKNILYRSKIPLYWNPRKSVMNCEFLKNDSNAATQSARLWNEQFSRILIYGYFEPKWVPIHAVVVFRPEHDLFRLFKSASTYSAYLFWLINDKIC